MKPEVGNWLEQAEHDIDVAEYNFDGNMLDAAAFYSQQAAEKALKSLYLSKFNKLWRVHDLVRIAKRVEAPTKIVDYVQKLLLHIPALDIPTSVTNMTVEMWKRF